MFLLIRGDKFSARRMKIQIYLRFSEPQPKFKPAKQIKFSARRAKKQILFEFSEPQSNFASVSYGGKSNN